MLIGVLAGVAVCRASELKPALEKFAAYEYGQPKKVLHDTRMAAFRGTNREQLRLENEQLLLAFVQSDAGVAARREACLWLSDLGTDASKPVLRKLAQEKDFADVAQIAMDELKEQRPATGKEPTNTLAQFKAAVMDSKKPVKLLAKGLKDDDKDQARLAFNLIAEGVAQKEAFQWLGKNFQALEESRQIVAMNLLVQADAAEKVPVIGKLSREGQGAARLEAIRHLGKLGRREDLAYLLDLWLVSDEAVAEAAQSALVAMPDAVVRGSLLKNLGSAVPAVQAKAIQLVELRGAAFAADELWRIAGQDSNPNQPAAIRALGRTAPATEYGRVLELFIKSEGSPVQKEWQLAVWDMSRRQPDYDLALATLDKKQATASEKTAGTLAALAAKLESLKTSRNLEDAREPRKPAKTKKKAPAKKQTKAAPKAEILLPGSYSDIVSKRFAVVAYLNCGPENVAKQNGVTISCQGKAWNSDPGTDPSLSVLFDNTSLDFTITGLESGQEYLLGLTWWGSLRNGRRQAIWINGKEVLPDTLALAFEEPSSGKQHKHQGKPTPVRIQFALLPEHIQGGTCKVTIKKTGQSNIVTSELWVAKRKQPRAEKQILLVSGQDFPGHHWRKTGPVMEEIVTADDRMEVTICETPGAVGLKHLDYYDVVFVHFKNYEEDIPATTAMKANLERFVMNGGGMCMSHFACGAFMEWPEFVTLSGRIWSGGAHDKRGPFTVKVVDKNHPVTKGLSDFETDDELYWCLTGEPKIHLLCEAFSQKKQANHPQAFAYEPGKGRVFFSTLGHDVKAYEPEQVRRLYRQGTAWAAGLE